jgi:fucose 4-O-acetylase-like acetyltransferase
VSRSPSFRFHPWAHVHHLADATPEGRNRYVDFLRAVSISVVVVGHWLMAAPTVETGLAFTLSDLLQVEPWTQWLTWAFQVMPIFFVVGGYANAASWESARARGDGYDHWVSMRLQRLVRPVIPFVLAWCAFAFVARWAGLGRRIVDTGSVAAFVPTWFLAVYVLVVVLAPVTYRLWRSSGMTSFWTLVAGAAVVDVVARMPGFLWVSWVNYVFVWLAIHQLGFAWHDGAFAQGRRALSFALGGFAALVVLKGLAGYPTSMVTVPGDTAANSNPPTLALLALGVMQAGLLLGFQARVRRWLERPTPWSLTVFVNGIIMTVYLWHATVMVLLVALLEWPGGIGLRLAPGTGMWWATRIPWLLALLAMLAGLLVVFGPLEARLRPSASTPSTFRNVVGALAVCGGLVALANGGIGGANLLGFWLWPVLLTLGGAMLVVLRGAPGRNPSAAMVESESET